MERLIRLKSDSAERRFWRHRGEEQILILRNLDCHIPIPEVRRSSIASLPVYQKVISKD